MDRLTHKLLQEAGLEKPSMGFKNSVMDAIILNAETQRVYRPLISKKGWGIVAIVSIICLVAFYFIPTQSGSIMESIGISQKLNLNFSLPNLEMSRTTMYAVGFMALFLVQVPFLKRYFENQNRYN